MLITSSLTHWRINRFNRHQTRNNTKIAIINLILPNNGKNLAAHGSVTRYSSGIKTFPVSMKTLDSYNFTNVDFIKIDVQGAELDVFKGGSKTLKNVLKIVCEVEFIQHYENQPLFGEVSDYLSQYNLMFNKFLGLSGRALKPIMLNNNPNLPSQHIWSDAVFVRHIQKIHSLNDEKLLKLGLLACVYYSLDLTFYCLSEYDKRHSTSFAKNWMSQIANKNFKKG